VWAFALTFIAHLAERTHLTAPPPYCKASLFCVRGVRVQTSTDDQIAIVKLIKCLDHKKAKEIKSKSLGRKLQSFLSSHARLAHTHTHLQKERDNTDTRRHAQVRTRNETEVVESFIDELFDQLTAGHCPSEDTAFVHLHGCGPSFYCLIKSFFCFLPHFHFVIP